MFATILKQVIMILTPSLILLLCQFNLTFAADDTSDGQNLTRFTLADSYIFKEKIKTRESFYGTLADDLSFPIGFQFGAASAAYQIEGARFEGGRGESTWDRIISTDPSFIVDESNADVACDSYHLYKRDVELAVELGLSFYRFSISWVRLLPTGWPHYISDDGRNYYNNLINELLANGIEPAITLYYWDLPQNLQKLGGWANPLIVDWFGDYAAVVYSLYADRVKTWVTLNDPLDFCGDGNSPYFPQFYLCHKNALLAHARAWRIYDEQYKQNFHGKMSMANMLHWVYATTKNDINLAKLVQQYYFGLYFHPIYSEEGGWPKGIEKIIAKSSKKQGFLKSRLPQFTQEEKKYIKGTYDYCCFNYYDSIIVVPYEDDSDKWYSYPYKIIYDMEVKFLNIDVVTNGHVPPTDIRKALKWFRNQYGNIDMVVCQNGFGTKIRNLNDDNRVEYLKNYLEQILLAIKKDDISVTGYTAWTMMDGFQWNDGYGLKLGLYDVDFDHPNRTRVPRKSALFYSNVTRLMSLNISDIPDLPSLAESSKVISFNKGSYWGSHIINSFCFIYFFIHETY